MSQIEYRKANSSDIVKLSVLFKQVYIATYGVEGVSDEFANFITKQFAPERLEGILDNLTVAAYKNNLVGVAEIQMEKKCPVGDLIAPELNKLYILEWFCGRGIGEQLLEMAESMVKAKGIDKIWLWVLDSNSRAINFYRKHGYKDIGQASFQMEVNSYDNLVMVKELIV